MTAQKLTYNSEYYEDLIRQTESFSEAFKQKLEQWIELVGYRFPASARALDAGCGTGSVMLFLLEHCEQVTGVDTSAYGLSHARRLVPKSSLCLCDLNLPLSFKSESFDLVVAYEVIEHLRCPEIFLKESWRVLKPGGAVLLKTPNAWDLWRILDPLRKKQWYADADKTHIRYHNPLGLRLLLKKAGFRGMKIRSGTKPFLYYRPRSRWNRSLPLLGFGLAAHARK